VTADLHRLTQVIENLLSNAVKFSPAFALVEVRLVQQVNAFRVEIEDHGPGIPQDFYDKLFTRFSQANNGDTRQQGSTGLGLYIAKTLITKMQGTIGFESELDYGSTFWIELPSA